MVQNRTAAHIFAVRHVRETWQVQLFSERVSPKLKTEKEVEGKNLLNMLFFSEKSLYSDIDNDLEVNGEQYLVRESTYLPCLPSEYVSRKMNESIVLHSKYSRSVLKPF